MGVASTDMQSGTVGPQQTGRDKKEKVSRKDTRGPEPKAPEKEARKASMRKAGRKEKENCGETHAHGTALKRMSTIRGISRDTAGVNHRGMMTGTGTHPGALDSGLRKEKGRRPKVKARARAKVGAGSPR